MLNRLKLYLFLYWKQEFIFFFESRIILHFNLKLHGKMNVFYTSKDQSRKYFSL